MKTREVAGALAFVLGVPALFTLAGAGVARAVCEIAGVVEPGEGTQLFVCLVAIAAGAGGVLVVMLEVDRP